MVQASVAWAQRQPVQNTPWARGAPRFFASGTGALGIISARAEGALGYGRPFYLATTAMAQGMTTAEYASGLVALRATLPFLETTFGMREVHAYWRTSMEARPRYAASDIGRHSGASSSMLYAHLEVTTNFPVGNSVLFGGFLWTKPLELERGRAIFDETHRVIVDPRGAVMFRTGALWTFGAVRIGPWAETFLVPRSGSPMVRVGPIATVRWTPHLDSLVGLNTMVTGPDDLGPFLGSFAFLNLRYRFATGEERPSFP